MTALRHTAWAAERLADLGEEEPEPDAEEPEEEGPITEPRPMTGGSLAMLSNGRVALSLTFLGCARDR